MSQALWAKHFALNAKRVRSARRGKEKNNYFSSPFVSWEGRREAILLGASCYRNWVKVPPVCAGFRGSCAPTCSCCPFFYRGCNCEYRTLDYPLFLSSSRLLNQKKEEKRRRKAVATLPHSRVPSGRSHVVVPNHLHPKNVDAVLGRTAVRILACSAGVFC